MWVRKCYSLRKTGCAQHRVISFYPVIVLFTVGYCSVIRNTIRGIIVTFGGCMLDRSFANVLLKTVARVMDPSWSPHTAIYYCVDFSSATAVSIRRRILDLPSHRSPHHPITLIHLYYSSVRCFNFCTVGLTENQGWKSSLFGEVVQFRDHIL